jgi:hypothetical protein
MAIVTTVGIDMPPEFPTQIYNDVQEIVTNFSGPPTPPFAHWASGWNAVAHRFLSAADHSRAFTTSISATGTGGTPDDLHRQEEKLFAFFASACSAIESFAYAVHAAGAMKDAATFPLAPATVLRQIDLRSTATKYQSFRPNAPLSLGLAAVAGDPDYRDDLAGRRNILLHRTALSRSVFVYVGAASSPGPPLWWRASHHGLPDIPLDAKTTASRLNWLTQTLERLVKELYDYAKAEMV